MTRKIRGVVLWSLLLLHAGPSFADKGEHWINLANNSALAGKDIRAIGQIRFPDGLSGVWISTPSGIWRLINGNWQRWPDNTDVTGEVRDILLAPDASGMTHWWLATDKGLLLTRNGEEWLRLNAANSPLSDDNIQALHLTQDQDGQAVVWIGTGQGLMQLRDDNWRVVLARSDGFHGGPISRLLGFETEAGQQIWATGRDGFSVYINGQWHRPDRTCLRRQSVHDVRLLTHSLGNRIGIATDHGLILIDPKNLEDCRHIDSPHAADQAVIALAGDNDHGLILLRPDGIERLQFQRLFEVSRWAWFDHRDGLPESIDWIAGQPTSDRDQILIAARRGLWRTKARQEDFSDHGGIELALFIEESGTVIENNESARIGDGTRRFAVQTRGIMRPHAALYRLSVDNGESWTAWQRTPEFEVAPLKLGWTTVQVEMIDDQGEQLGPWRFHIERIVQVGMISALSVAILALIITLITVMTIRRKRSAA